MPIDKIQLTIPPSKRPVDPLEIFQKLTLRGPIKNIWEPQADALRKWHLDRNATDVLVQMNTGGGKTLVGLIVAQSIVNETKGRVLYVCPNNQLVEQTIERGKEIGISPASYFDSNWSDSKEYELGNVFCVTNYASVFNGKSIFSSHDLCAVIFDDAHVAENLIRGHYTLRLDREHPTFGKVLNYCRRHLVNSGQQERLDDVIAGRSNSMLFVPMFAVYEDVAAIRKALIEGGIDKDKGTLFVWEHLKNQLNHCCILAEANGLEISPPVIPISTLGIFQANVRRVYLTATLPSPSSFTRAFGISTPTVVRPAGKSGEAQRLIVFSAGEDDEEHRTQAIALVRTRKSCVISPSQRKAGQWIPPGKLYSTSSGQAEITRFCGSSEAEMLVFAARYDGIDLPGDACRVLIMDRLPAGESLFERFIDEQIQVETIRLSRTATRVIQAIGRIFRSNTDHGVVVLVGKQLQSWMRTPKNRGFLTELLQRQLLLGIELSKQVEAGKVTWEELVDGLLGADKKWDGLYNEYIEKFGTEVVAPGADWHIKIVLREKEAFAQLWDGQSQKAAQTYAELAKEASDYDENLAAWYHHWAGLSLLCCGENEKAQTEFITAANIRSELIHPSEKIQRSFRPSKPKEAGPQAKALASRFASKRGGIQRDMATIERDLKYGMETSKAEEALRLLGELIGLNSSRPDKDIRTGPDVLWEGSGKIKAHGFELKTNKDANGEYSKSEISSCLGHLSWIDKKFDTSVKLSIVGRYLQVSPKANPTARLEVVELESIIELFARAKAMIGTIEGANQTDIESLCQFWLNDFGLLWPRCVLSLSRRQVTDLVV